MPPTWVPPVGRLGARDLEALGSHHDGGALAGLMPSMLQPAAELGAEGGDGGREPDRVSTVHGHRLVWPMKPATNTVAGLS